MSNHYEFFGLIAGLLSFVGFIPYIISIFKKKTIPNKTTWIIWTLVGALLWLSYSKVGDPNASWLPLGYFLGPFVIAILAFKYGYSYWSKLDVICLLVAGISVLPWILTKSPLFTLLINVLIDFTGALPTITKTHRQPETEDLTAWVIFLTANFFELLAISVWDVTIVYPLYLFLLSLTIVFLILKNTNYSGYRA